LGKMTLFFPLSVSLSIPCFERRQIHSFERMSTILRDRSIQPNGTGVLV
jgi:hypothetical protein